MKNTGRGRGYNLSAIKSGQLGRADIPQCLAFGCFIILQMEQAKSYQARDEQNIHGVEVGPGIDIETHPKCELTADLTGGTVTLIGEMGPPRSEPRLGGDSASPRG